MDVLNVQRKATAVNVELKFQFDNTGLEFLVKNFTEDDIYVGFKAGGEQREAYPDSSRNSTGSGRNGRTRK